MIQIDQDSSITPLWARSPAELKFSVNSFLKVRGSAAAVLFTLDRTNPPSAGQSFQLDWALGSVLFTIDTSAAAIDLIPEVSGSGFSTYVQTVYDILNANPTLSKYFSVTYLFYDGTIGLIQLIARNNGVSSSVAVTTNTTTFGIDATAGADDVAYTDDEIKLYIELFSNRAYEMKTTRYDDLIAAGVPNLDSNVNTYKFYELPALCRSLMGVDTNIPFGTWFYNSKNYVLARFNAFNTKTDGTTLLQDGYTNGQLSLPTNNILSIYGRSASLYNSTTGLLVFLVTMPVPTLISEDHPLWLTIPIHIVPADYTLYAGVTFDDSSSDLITIAIPQPVFGLISVPGGYRQLGLDLRNPGKVPTKIDLTMTVNDGSGEIQYSDTRTYYYDTRFSQYNRYFLFQNSLGGYDTLRCRGVNDFETKTGRQTALHTRTVDTDQNRGTIEMTYAQEERIWTMRTGWMLTIEDMNWLRELLLTNYAAEVLMDEQLYSHKEHNQWRTPLRSVVVQADSVKQYKEDDGMWAMEWKMKVADDQNVAFDNSIKYNDNSQLYADSEFEFEVTATALTSDTELDIAASGIIGVYTNGEIVGMPYRFPNGLETVRFKIIGYRLDNISISALFMNANIAITKISGPFIQSLSISGFDNLECGYLLKRLPSMWKLSVLIIEMAGEGGLPINEILLLMAANMASGIYVSFVLLLSETPSAAGMLAKDYINGSGATCITY